MKRQEKYDCLAFALLGGLGFFVIIAGILGVLYLLT